MNEAEFVLPDRETEKLHVQLTASNFITPCGKDDRSEGKLPVEELPENPDEEIHLYTGSSRIHDELETVFEKLQKEDYILHAPITVLEERREFIEENREKLLLNLHIDREIDPVTKNSIKEFLKTLEGNRGIKFFYHIHEDIDDDLFIQQLSAILPYSRINLLVTERTEENVSHALKLADKMLTIGRRKEMGIGWNIPEVRRNKELEEKLFCNRTKDVEWLQCSLKGSYLNP